MMNFLTKDFSSPFKPTIQIAMLVTDQQMAHVRTKLRSVSPNCLQTNKEGATEVTNTKDKGMTMPFA